MDPALFTRVDPMTWRVEPTGRMRVPAIIYADEDLIRGMDDKVFAQATNVAMLPGIVGASYAMPDAHWGYGFPIGGVAAFDAACGGVVSAGGVGIDISCGVHTMLTSLPVSDIINVQNSGATLSGSKKEARWPAPSPKWSPNVPRRGSAARWARSAPATITLKSRLSSAV